MSETDEDLRDEVNNALEGDEPDEAAEDDQDDPEAGDAPDDGTDDIEEGDDSEEDDKPTGKDKARSAPADDEDLEDDDDEAALDYARPEFTGSTPATEEFDIRTLPKDPETGLVDPVEANRLINEWRQKNDSISNQAKERAEKTKQLLTQQWIRVSKKYPAVYKNPRLRDLAREKHLNSIGTDNYLTPAQAAAKIERTRRELVKTGYKSAKTRRSVETMTRSERSSGRTDTADKQNDYEKAKAAANSRDPQKAKQGRMTLLKLRREARLRAR